MCRSCLGRQAKALKTTYWERIPELDPPGACESCGLPRSWTIAPDGVVVALCLSCVLALLWDQGQQLEGLRKIVQAMTAPPPTPKPGGTLALARVGRDRP